LNNNSDRVHPQAGHHGKLLGNVRYWVQAAAIAGVYATLTVALSPISYGAVQVRVSEALTVLPAVTPAAIPGLFVGCLIANLISPFGTPDLIIGSAASLLAAFFSWLLRARAWLVPLPPVLVNAALIGGMLYYIYGVPPSLLVDMGWVALGQVLACYVLGFPLLKYLERHPGVFRL
jgi:uncharacterized membrane protein